MQGGTRMGPLGGASPCSLEEEGVVARGSSHPPPAHAFNFRKDSPANAVPRSRFLANVHQAMLINALSDIGG